MRFSREGVLVAVLALTGAARGQEAPVLSIEFKDGVIAPQRLEAPAGAKFRLEVRNAGAAAAEFESKELKAEKLIAAGGKIVLNFRDLTPGDYKFFDDFHPDAPGGVLVVK